MRLEEIIISDELKIFEIIKDSKTTRMIYALYEVVQSESHEFTYENYEIYPSDTVSEFLTELDYLSRYAQYVFDPSDQAMEVLKFLTDYFER